MCTKESGEVEGWLTSVPLDRPRLFASQCNGITNK
jgi:hypothetical protein